MGTRVVGKHEHNSAHRPPFFFSRRFPLSFAQFARHRELDRGDCRVIRKAIVEYVYVQYESYEPMTNSKANDEYIGQKCVIPS